MLMKRLNIPEKEQQMQLMFWLGLKDAYSASHQLIQQVLLARPALVHDRQDCELDPIFLEEYALFQAIIIHDLGRIVNLADFEDTNEEQAIYIEQCKAHVNRFYHQTESSYLSNMDFTSIFRSKSRRTFAPTMEESSPTEVSPPQFKRDWKGYIDWCSKWLRPVAELDLGCTARYVAENAVAYAYLLDASTGQFSYDDTCEVPNWHLSRIYHVLENILREYMCITEDECLLVKAKQILKQKWPVSNEVLHLMDLILRYRRAAHSQFSSDDITDRHKIWDDMLVGVSWQLAQSAREASRATSPFVEPRSREPLHGESRNSISKRWRVNRWSIKPFISKVKDMQYHVSRAFGACLHTDPGQHDFDYSPIMQSIHQEALKARLVPDKFDPSFRIIRWVTPLLPWEVDMKWLWDEPPGTLTKMYYVKRDGFLDSHI